MEECCPYCGKTDAELYAANQICREIKDDARNFYQCNYCYTIYPRPRLSYDEVRFHPGYHGVTSSFLEKDPKDSVSDYKVMCDLLRRYRFHTVLDIGAQDGSFCYALSQMGKEVTGLEPDNAARSCAEKNGIPVLSGLFPEILPDEIRGKKYDLITLLEVSYYLSDLKKSLDTIYGMLQDDGLFFIKTNHSGSGYYKDGTSLFSRMGDSMQSMPSIKSLKFTLNASGFELIKMMPYPDRYSAEYIGFPIGKSLYILYKWYGLILNLDIPPINRADRILLIAKKDTTKKKHYLGNK